jgi:glycosyltransferase involved in cell wall biosynthesis
MKVSVVIPTLNEENNIPYLLKDLSKQTVKPFEIIVVDGKSQDKTRSIIKKEKNVKLFLSNPCVAKQRNIGGMKSRGEVIFFLDADTRLKNDFIEKSIAFIKKTNASIICPFYLPYKSTPLITFIYIFFSSLFFIFQKISASGAGSCIIVKKEVFDLIKFNEILKFDDIEFIRRASRSFLFKTMPQSIYVSDRRFKQYGVIKMFLYYLVLSIFFFCNQFTLVNYLPYTFSKYNKND